MIRGRSKAAAVAALAVPLAAAACGGHADGAARTASVHAAPAAQLSLQLIWSRTGTFFSGPQVWYVARVTNPGSSAASVAINARAMDASGTIVGSAQETLPNVPAHGRFDYFGYLGGGGMLDTKLTGKPTKIEVTQAKNAFGRAGSVEQPMLATSEVKLAAGSAGDTNTDAPLGYNLTAKVTNSTGNDIRGGSYAVIQQVVLYDSAGHVVGGDTGGSDNVPDDLPAGMSYRETWTGIPAVQQAVRAVFTIWPAS